MERRVGSLVWHWQRNDYIADSAVLPLSVNKAEGAFAARPWIPLLNRHS